MCKVMPLSLNPHASSFQPNNSYLHFEVPVMNPQNAFEDEFLEYAYENGLWGISGSDKKPTSKEIASMRRKFCEHHIAIHGFNDYIDYMIDDASDDASDDEDEEQVTTEIQIGSEIGSEIGSGIEINKADVEPVTDDVDVELVYIDLDIEETIIPNGECGECGENDVAVEYCPESNDTFCNKCWMYYDNTFFSSDEETESE